MKPQWREWLAYALLILFAFLLRLPHFTPLALIGSDGSEYVYCVQEGVFPHSPYILHMWAGFLLNPIVRLDWGYSALSMVSNLLSILLFGGVVRALTGSFWSGWFAALVLTVTPVSIRFAGFQEVYAFQFFWIALCWYLLLRKRSFFWSGVALGAAFSTHTGTVFAGPATAVLIYQSVEDRLLSRKTLLGFVKFSLGFLAPVVLAFGWLTSIWLTKSNQPLSLLPVFIRGAAPSPNLGLLFGPQAGDYLEEQIFRTWNDLSNLEVIGPVLLAGGVLSFVLVPISRSLPWLLLTLPYLLYEVAMGYALDPGIFLIFVAPTVSVGMGYLFWRFLAFNREGWGLILLIPLIAIGIGAGFTLKDFQRTADVRNLLPWIQPNSATMALSRFVEEHSPEDTLLIQPVDWDPTGLASTLYSHRTPLFNDGEILLQEPWKPLFTNPVFKHVRSVKTEDFDRWLDEDRPILCFDEDPFTSWGCYWPFVEIEDFETRPILWLNQNESGTSRGWEDAFPLATFEPGIEPPPSRFALQIPETAGRATVELPVFRPILYRIARKSDPPGHPEWARKLQELVPENQRGDVPKIRLMGVGFEAKEGAIEATVPTLAGKAHILRLTVNSHGADYIVECQVKSHGRWIAVGRDMEKIVTGPPMQFADLYFKVPKELVERSVLEIRFRAILGTERMNAYRVSVAAVPPEG
ncbi:MAG: hypothetical protein H6751_17975 [Candidatus Omnitrophica bacterium]|nr:hypothetical protein [Candidatus Omnitrophota bacterium]